MEYHNLQELMKNLTYKDHAIMQGLGITGIQYDSRKVELGNLFVAIKGFQSDGHKYIQNAVANNRSHPGMFLPFYKYPFHRIKSLRLSDTKVL